MRRVILTTDAVACLETVKNGINIFRISIRSINELVEKMICFVEYSEQIKLMRAESRFIVEAKFQVNKIGIKMLKTM